MLKTKLGTAEAEAFVEILDSRVNQKFEDQKEILATKADVSNAKAELLKALYTTQIINYLAIVGSILAIAAIFKA